MCWTPLVLKLIFRITLAAALLTYVQKDVSSMLCNVNLVILRKGTLGQFPRNLFKIITFNLKESSPSTEGVGSQQKPDPTTKKNFDLISIYIRSLSLDNERKKDPTSGAQTTVENQALFTDDFSNK